MAKNVYIGARYVPLIDGEWSADKTYEPLTIVTKAGNSYTSKIAVPAGAPLSDPKYWAQTGSFSQQVASVQEQVNRINGLLLRNPIDISDPTYSVPGAVVQDGFMVGYSSGTYINIGGAIAAAISGWNNIAKIPGNPCNLPPNKWLPVNLVFVTLSENKITDRTFLQIKFDGANTYIDIALTNSEFTGKKVFFRAQTFVAIEDVRG